MLSPSTDLPCMLTGLPVGEAGGGKDASAAGRADEGSGTGQVVLFRAGRRQQTPEFLIRRMCAIASSRARVVAPGRRRFDKHDE